VVAVGAGAAELASASAVAEEAVVVVLVSVVAVAEEAVVLAPWQVDSLAFRK
jgi:hypothetical protein